MTSMPDKVLTTEKLFKCDQCSFSSTLKYNLITHIKTHVRDKPFKCVHCSYCASKQTYLNLHNRIHTGEKPFKCDQCSYSSAKKHRLIDHKRTHTGEKPFKCDQCSYSSTQCSALTVHYRKHTGEKPFKCDQCSYSSTRSSRVIEHKRTHTGEKPFKCDQCSYSSAHYSTLTLHKRTHTNEKPFKCYECSYSFAKYFQFFEHTRIHMFSTSKSSLEVQFSNRRHPGTQSSFSLNRESSQPSLYEIPYARMEIKSCKVKLHRLTTAQIQSYQKLNSFVAIKFENEYADSIDCNSSTSILGLKSGKVKLRRPSNERIKSFGRQTSSDEDNESESAECVDHPCVNEATIFGDESFKLGVFDIKTEPIDSVRDELKCLNAAEPNEISSNQKDTSIKIEPPYCDESVSIFMENSN